jgi:hypothetical protein
MIFKNRPIRNKNCLWQLNKNHGETFLLRVQVLTNGSGKHEYSDDVLIVKLDSVLKVASVDIIPGLIMENITDVYLYCLLYNIGHSIHDSC